MGSLNFLLVIFIFCGYIFALFDFITALSHNNFKKTVFLKQKNSFFYSKKTVFLKLSSQKAVIRSQKAKIKQYWL